MFELWLGLNCWLSLLSHFLRLADYLCSAIFYVLLTISAQPFFTSCWLSLLSHFLRLADYLCSAIFYVLLTISAQPFFTSCWLSLLSHFFTSCWLSLLSHFLRLADYLCSAIFYVLLTISAQPFLRHEVFLSKGSRESAVICEICLESSNGKYTGQNQPQTLYPRWKVEMK